jgi:flagellar basal body-associated protein FliL
LLVPVIAGSVVTIGTAVTALAMYFSKQSAQNNANSVGSDIVNYAVRTGAVRPDQTGMVSCNPPYPAKIANAISASCAQWVQDNNDVNNDATIGNIALAVSIVAAAGTVAVITYWIIADHQDNSGKTARGPVVMPYFTPSINGAPSNGGVTLSGSF